MIDGPGPYPSMKGSGVPWLRNIPNHWKMARGKNLLKCVDVRSSTGEEELLTVSSARGVIPRRTANVTMFKAESYVGYKLCWPGDLVINSLWAWARGLGVSAHHGIVSSAYGVYRPKRADEIIPGYLHELVRSTAFHWELFVRSKGVWTSRLQLTDDSFLCAPFPLPPPDEQAAIVRFLDHADQRIRRYISAKRKLIALLNEQKQAIIHKAVTRGLDPNVKLKPSGVEWLGEVPDGWRPLLLGRGLRRIEQGWSPVAAEGETTPDQWVVLTLSSVKRGMFNPNAAKPIPISASIPSRMEVKEGDLLLTRSNTRELVGDTCIAQSVRPKTILCDLIYRLTPDPAVFHSPFLALQLLSPLVRKQIERDARGSSGTMPKISQRHIRSWSVLAPSLREQVRIADTMASATQNITIALVRATTEIDLLREYRTRLIADVVTGKLDVREAAAKLPNEVQDNEPLEPETDEAEEAEDTEPEEALVEAEA